FCRRLLRPGPAPPTAPAAARARGGRLDQNDSAFRDLGLQLVPQTRLCDKEGFFISDAGFEHCKNADTVCAWKKIG
ncbi:hypothetical protein, partial [Streptomyces hayashii]|uniref:hypothetical protein n=1 Tax=Streptomyces hayashii TaxID=2839966 RepID=UPI00403CBEAB